METILHMNTGDGENSYAQNSATQRYAMAKVRPILEENVKSSYGKTSPKCFAMADLGCSSGSNSLVPTSIVIEAITAFCSQTGNSLPEIQVFLNDLPGNDFNSIFKLLPDFYEKLQAQESGQKNHEGPKCFVSAVPGSFFARLFPKSSLHFVHSSYSLHWLSQAPDGLENNKKNVFISTTSPPGVAEAYLKQYQSDFSSFLSARAQEVVSDGRMMLTFIGRDSTDATAREDNMVFDLLTKSLLDMATEGLIEEAAIDSLNVPVYKPCKEEVKDIVEKEGSFTIDMLEYLEVNRYDQGSGDGSKQCEVDVMGRNMASSTRAVAEPVLIQHFGEGLSMDDLFQRYARHAAEELATQKMKNTNIVVSLIRK